MEPGRAVFPLFFLFTKPERPSWWTEADDCLMEGDALGVHASPHGERVGSFVVSEDAIAVLGDTGVSMRIPYESIRGWKPVWKRPEACKVELLL